VAGNYRPEWLDGRDADGVSLREALLAFGGDPEGVAGIARRRDEVAGYLEVHIEQGPQLEAADLAVGVVTAINGIDRARITVTGEAGHAGTVPMPMRADALAAAAEMVGIVERAGAARADTVATVGALQVRPGAINVIPARVDFTLDARAPDDAVRRAMMETIRAEWDAVARRRGVSLAVETVMDSPATPMDPGLVAALEAAAARLQIAAPRLPSGAGHDAVAMATLCPSAMLFVRCRGGISHNPAESITEADADTAVRVLIEAIKGLAAER
jgi:allantoate deiminase